MPALGATIPAAGFPIMQPLWIINAVGLVHAHLGSDMPALNRWAGAGQVVDLMPSLPAVTTTAQTTMLTGVDPDQHGIVGNGWYFRDLSEVWLWRQSEALVTAPLPWSTANGPRTLKHFWWYAMNSRAAAAVTPRPAYHQDGSKSPDFYTNPAELKTALQAHHGAFPLFSFWGPATSIASTAWIGASFLSAVERTRPALALCYLPHLDYDLQRFGPNGQHLAGNLRALDGVIAPILAAAAAQSARVMVVSEYGIAAVDHAVYLNRVLRTAGYLTVTTNATGELIDYGPSRAFAVVDHQAAHVYVRDQADVASVAALLRGIDGVAEIYVGTERAQVGLDHARSGEIVAFAAPGCWFAHDWWLDPSAAPDFANCVEIHKKPGYDPRELVFDRNGGKRRAIIGLLKKKLGLRYRLNAITGDDRLIKGSHGRMPSAADRPVLIAPADVAMDGCAHQRDVRSVINRLTRGMP